MAVDRWGNPLTTVGQEAADRFSDAVLAYLEFRRDTGDKLKALFAADGDMPLAHILRGYFFKLFAVPGLEERARKAVADSEARIAKQGATERERGHVAALAAWAAGDYARTIACWDRILVDHPHDMLALRLGHFTQFYMGQSARVRNSIARVLPYWAGDDPDLPFLHGMYAFGLEECGDYTAAERFGRLAVARHPDDPWSVHAVAHVLEMTGRVREGLSFLDGLERHWSACNNFAYHMWWHRCLYHYELGQYEACLELYDTRVRADKSDEYLDITNAVALLWRLEDRGVAVGDRWVELTTRCETRARDHLMAFPDMHYVMALVAGGKFEAASAMVGAMATLPDDEAHYEQRALRHVGKPLAEAIIAYRRGDFASVIDRMLPIRYGLQPIGGSHAQRDVWVLMLIEAAIRGKRNPLARALLAERLAQRPTSATTWANYADVLEALGDSKQAGAARTKTAELRTA